MHLVLTAVYPKRNSFLLKTGQRQPMFKFLLVRLAEREKLVPPNSSPAIAKRKTQKVWCLMLRPPIAVVVIRRSLKIGVQWTQVARGCYKRHNRPTEKSENPVLSGPPDVVWGGNGRHVEARPSCWLRPVGCVGRVPFKLLVRLRACKPGTARP